MERVETEEVQAEKGSMLEVLKDRNFITFEIAQFFWNFSIAIIMSSLSAFAVNVFEIHNEFDFGLLGIMLLGVIGGFIFVWTVKGDDLGKKKSLMISLLLLSITLPFTVIFLLTPPSLILFEILNVIKIPIVLPSSAIVPIQTQGILFFICIAPGFAGLNILPYSILMGIVKKDQEATYIGFNSTFISISNTVANLFMGLLTFSLGGKLVFYVIGPILGAFAFLALLFISKLKED